MLDFFGASFSGLHPGGIRLGVGQVAVSFSAFLGKRAQRLLLGVVDNKFWRDSVPLEYK